MVVETDELLSPNSWQDLHHDKETRYRQYVQGDGNVRVGVCRAHKLEISNNNNSKVGACSLEPETSLLSTCQVSVENDTGRHDHVSLANSLQDPFVESHFVEASVQNANVVELGISEELLLGHLPVEDTEPDDGDGCEHDVVALVHPSLVEGLARESGPETVPILREDHQDVLVEDVTDQIGIPSVSFSAVHEHQRLQVFELPDGKVTGSCSLLTLLT